MIVLASSVSPSGSIMKGFGADSRDNGQSRVPAPPERMMGTSATRRALDESKNGIVPRTSRLLLRRRGALMSYYCASGRLHRVHREEDGQFIGKPGALLRGRRGVPNYGSVPTYGKWYLRAVVSFTHQREPRNVARRRTSYRGRPGFDGDCEAARGMPRCSTL